MLNHLYPFKLPLNVKRNKKIISDRQSLRKYTIHESFLHKLCKDVYQMTQN